MAKKEKPQLTPAIAKYYAEGSEKDRLSEHRLEKDRTLRILKKWLPPAPATILDVGGAAGVYAFPLAEMGYEVHLIDPVPLHVSQAKKHAKSVKIKLAGCEVGDARKIERKDRFADAVLFLGPLYHLTDAKDRHQALQEAKRVLKPGGLLLAAGISRFASLMDAMHKGTLYSKLPIVEKDFLTGEHQKTSEGTTFTYLYLHRPEDLKKEIEKNGFENVTLRSIEGPVWERRVLDTLSQDEEGWERLLDLLEEIETEETLLGASAHILATGYNKK